MHYGSIPGSYTMQILVPETDLGVFIAYNGALQTDPYTINSMIFTYILDLVLDSTPWITSPEYACDFLNSSHLSPPVLRPNNSRRTNFTAHHAVPYVGLFSHPLLGDVRVRYEEPRLLIGYGCFEGELAGETGVPSSSSGSENFLALPKDETWLLMLYSVKVTFSSSSLASASNRSVFTRLALPSLEQDMEFSRIEEDDLSRDIDRKHLDDDDDDKAFPLQCSDCVTLVRCPGVTVFSALVCVVTSLDFS